MEKKVIRRGPSRAALIYAGVGRFSLGGPTSAISTCAFVFSTKASRTLAVGSGWNFRLIAHQLGIQ